MSDLKPFFKAFRAGDVEAVHKLLNERVDLSGATFKDAATGNFDFRELDFSNTEFQDCVLTGVNWADADLSGAYFHGSTLIECDLSGANLEGAAFEGCVLKQVIFAGATLAETEVSGTEMDQCTLAESTLDGAEWESVTLNGGRIENISGAAELTGVTLREVTVVNFDTSAMTLARCSTSATPAPEGFRSLTGRRTRL
ncbi:MAG: secreted effector protein PipB2 [Bradymonadia bacterium]|jgi:secreted effector protein PipB2